MIEVPSSRDRIVLVGEFHGFAPDELFDHFITPDLLVSWWPKEATVEPYVEGSYAFSWPEQNWHLRGKYNAFDRGQHLGFTWAWDHGPEGEVPLQVDLYFAPLDEGHGTKMSIFHGPFLDTEQGKGDRQGIVEGWIHFGMKMAGLRAGEAV